MLLRAAEASVCKQNPGFSEPLIVRSRLSTLISWWRGDASFIEAQRMGLGIIGPRVLVRAFPEWFDRYQLAEIGPVLHRDALMRSKTGHIPERAPTQIAGPL